MEEDVIDSVDSGADISLSKLEHANQKLKEQNSVLAEKLNSSAHKLHNRVSVCVTDRLSQSM